jgi:mannosyltransferase
VGAATIVAALLRLYRLGSQNLWVDEVLSWYKAHIGSPLTSDLLLENVHGPLYSVILHLWGGLFGQSEWALRLLSALMGIVTVPVIAWVAARWLGRSAAVPAAWLAAVSPFLVWYSQEARNYAMVVLCSGLSAAALLALRERFSARALVGYLGASAAGLLANFSFAFLAPLHVWWWRGVSGGRGRRWLFGIMAVLLMMAIMLPWIPTLLSIWDWTRLRPGRPIPLDEPLLRGATTFHAWALPFGLFSFAVGYTLGPSLRELRADHSLAMLTPHLGWIVASAAVFGVLIVLAARALHRRGRLAEGALWIGVPVLLLSYFAWQNFKVFHPRYVAVLMPGLIAALGAALADLRPRARAAFALAIGVLWAVSLRNHFFDPRHSKEDMRGAASFLARSEMAGEKIVSANAAAPLYYYYRGSLPVHHYWLGFTADPARMASRFEAMVGDSAAWVVLTRPEDLDPHGRFAGYLEERHPEARRFDFNGVTLWRLPGGHAAPGRR